MGGLVIGQGNPWWLSPNVWVVPVVQGSNLPDPFPGVIHPVVGQQYNLVAKFSNTSEENFPDASVFFYWANPSLSIDTDHAHLIGSWSGGVDSSPNPPDPGPANIVWETPAWTPNFENNGHECIIAAVVEDGLIPSGPLNGDNYPPTIAQRNLGVVQPSGHNKGRFQYTFEVCNPARVERSFTVAAEAARPAEAARILKSLGREARPGEKPGSPEHLGVVRTRSPGSSDLDAAHPVLEGVRLAPLSCAGFSLVGTLTEGMSLIHVTQIFEGRIVGGLSVLALAEDTVRG
jgi:hypothetical protein